MQLQHLRRPITAKYKLQSIQPLLCTFTGPDELPYWPLNQVLWHIESKISRFLFKSLCDWTPGASTCCQSQQRESNWEDVFTAKETLNASWGHTARVWLWGGGVRTHVSKNPPRVWILLTYDATASSCLFYLTSLPAAATGSRFRVNVAQSYLVYERVNDEESAKRTLLRKTLNA